MCSTRRPTPRPCPRPRWLDEPTRWAIRGITAALAGILLWSASIVGSHNGVTLAWFLLAITVLSWWRARQPIRYLLAVAAMTAIRWYVVRKTEPYRAQLGEPGRVTDPDAPWRQWLETRCPTCGV